MTGLALGVFQFRCPLQFLIVLYLIMLNFQRSVFFSTARRVFGYLRVLMRLSPGYCNVCDRGVLGFLPYRIGAASLSPILRDLDLVGSDLERFGCPHCGSTDRERHLLAYMQRTGLLALAGKRVLHFAPEKNMRLLIKATGPVEYVQGDLFPKDAQITRVDITKMQFPDGYFDLLIANHVLEHVPEDIAALREIVRVLKPGGHAILQTPYATKLQCSLALSHISSDAARLALYGQEDHVRLYGADIFERITHAGLLSRVQVHGELLADMDSHRHGMNPREPFMHWVKP